MTEMASVLRYNEFGKPAVVVQKYEEPIPSPTADEVLVKILAAPINPADVITILGKYSVKPKLPAIPGNECVGEVLKAGANVTNLKPGDYVVPLTTGLGTWRSHAAFKATDLMAVPKTMGLAESAAITVNPCTSYRMLKDFVQLQAGDTVIQNGANSSCGQYAFQLCKVWKVNCIGIVRDRPGVDKLKQLLKEMGATEVLTEEELTTTTIFETGKYPAPKLALNCVGGTSAAGLVTHLADKGIMVTYGEKSGQPVVASMPAMLYRDIQYRGFWMTRWRKTQSPDSPLRKEMFEDLFQMTERGQLKAPIHEMVPFNDFADALEKTANAKGFLGKKIILKL